MALTLYDKCVIKAKERNEDVVLIIYVPIEFLFKPEDQQKFHFKLCSMHKDHIENTPNKKFIMRVQPDERFKILLRSNYILPLEIPEELQLLEIKHGLS